MIIDVPHLQPISNNEFPVEILAYAIHRDSVGLGRFRGAAGMVRDVRALAPRVTLGTRMNNLKSPSWGVKGGKAGAVGRIVLNPDTPQAQDIRLAADTGMPSVDGGNSADVRSRSLIYPTGGTAPTRVITSFDAG